MPRLRALERELNRFLGQPKARTDKRTYRQFRALIAELRATYAVTADGFIEIAPCNRLPRGLTTAHYTWGETTERIRHCLAHPEDVDKDGCYGE